MRHFQLRRVHHLAERLDLRQQVLRLAHEQLVEHVLQHRQQRRVDVGEVGELARVDVSSATNHSSW